MDEELRELSTITYKAYFKSIICRPEDVGTSMNAQLEKYLDRHPDAWIESFSVVPLLGNLVLVVMKAMWENG